MNKQHSIIDNVNYNVINIDNSVLNVVQKKANIIFKYNGITDKLGELKRYNVNIDYNFIIIKLNNLFLSMNDDLNRLIVIDRELDIIINNISGYSRGLNLVKHL